MAGPSVQEGKLSRALSIRRLGRGFLRKAKEALGRGAPDVGSMTEEYRSFWSQVADTAGADFSSLTDDLWRLERGGREVWIAGSQMEFDDPVRLRAAADKLLTYDIATRLSVPVPDHRAFTLGTIAEAQAFMAGATGPFVVKPARGTAAAGGVTTEVDRRGLDRAAVLASTYDSQLIVESMIAGETYRLLFMEGELLHAVRRRGLRIEGDGATTVLRLLLRAGVTRPQSDELLGATLRRQGIGWSTVLPQGRSVVARGVPETTGTREPRTIYDEVVHTLPESLVADVAGVVGALGLDLAGVDVVTADPEAWPDTALGVLLEVNGTPALHHHFVPAPKEEGVELGVRILERLFERAR